MSYDVTPNGEPKEDVDVEFSVKGSTTDSGIDTTESCSTECPTSSDSEISPVKHIELDQNVNCLEKTQSQICPTSLHVESFERNIHLEIRNEMPSENCPLDASSDHKNSQHFSENNLEISNGANDTQINKVKGEHNTYINDSCFKDISKNLATSTVSLNETKCSVLDNFILAKSSLSKSAENILMINQSSGETHKLSNTELNSDQILTQFAAHKSKVAAVQKIPENLQMLSTINLDVKYPRFPKEIRTQDIGSIVKNVHGIFSSVGGSLMNAYNQKQKAQQHYKTNKLPAKTIPNGKIVEEIFEDEKTDANNVVKEIEQVNEIMPDIPNLVLKENINVAEISNNMEGDPKTQVYKLQIESLERVLADLRKENVGLRDRVKQQVDDINVKDQMFKDLEQKIDSMSKRVEQAEKEKDAAVMRYASVECAAIEAKRAAETSARAERAATTEVELLNNKLKSAANEKQRICQLYDNKCHELLNCERELGKTREDMRELEGRLKWTQSKLRMEMDAYKETAEKAERLQQQLQDLEATREAVAAGASDLAKAKQIEAELKESQAALILLRHEKAELEKRLTSTTTQFDICKRERDSANTCLTRANHEVEELKASNLRLEEEAAELAALRAQAALADTLSAQLQRESERATLAEEALSKERARAETCARREAAALEHSAKLTGQHVATRAAADACAAKARALSADNVGLRERIMILETECAKLQTTLNEEVERRNSENKVLARKVAELTEDLKEAVKKLEWEKGENSVLKKKHASAIKELNRELQRTLKRCEQLESKLTQNDAPSTRTGSISSLSSGESTQQEDKLQNGQAEMPDVQIKNPRLIDKIQAKVREPDRQTLIERIVSLQREAARRSDRCEFLEEHAKQLTSELRKKSRLLRHLLPGLPGASLSNENSDKHKKEIARLGGSSMAALWGGDPNGMTLELSLEMNRRLQAILEDTLLKNITLKENMDTLGAEIARLRDTKTSNTESN